MMVGITEVSAAYSGIKAALGIAKGISSLRTETEINQAVIDIQRTLLDAQSAAFEDRANIAALREEMNVLQRQLVAKTEWQAERSRYVLTASSGGSFTYDLRPDAANGEVAHRLCVKCFEDGRKSILHTTTKHSGGEIVHCPHCQSDLTLSAFQNTVRIVRNDSGRDWAGY